MGTVLLLGWILMPPTGPPPPPSSKPPNPKKTTAKPKCCSIAARAFPRPIASIMTSVQYISLGASLRSLRRQRPLHQILGGGIIADVILWRRKNVTSGILLGALASWVIFEVAGYALVSFVSNVLLLLISILFLWAKAARILNRPPPPIPEMHITEEMIRETAFFVGFHVNRVLSAFNDVVHRKDTKIFYVIAICLCLISFIGGLTNILTLIYSSLAIILTIPVLYEKYQDCVDRYFKLAHMEVQIYERVYIQCFCKYFITSRKWLLEVKKFLNDI